MTDSTTSESVAVAIAEMRGEIRAGFAEQAGTLALLVHRSNRTDETLAAHDTRIDMVERGETERQKRNDARLDALERSRWPVASVGALTGAGGLALALWTFASR
ncbi:hypothetical protein ABZ567_31135 [Streptomyces sp. NPDC016459]|uniref:hypothetical protein n=1 Tax=Streptomyces sp. NPDC016459 TaxID=3157190 RepID=UPI0033E12B14